MLFRSVSQSRYSLQTGAYSFFEAKLLSITVRSNVKYYFEASSPSIIKEFLASCELFSVQLDEKLKKALELFASQTVKKGSPLIFSNDQKAILEDYQATQASIDGESLELLKGFIGENLALFDDGDIKSIALPVLARNKLSNGISQNLWYEEVVPKQSKFYLFIVTGKQIGRASCRERV